MTGQQFPGGVRTQIGFCCEEIVQAGMSDVIGVPNAYLEVPVAGGYWASCSVPVLDNSDLSPTVLSVGGNGENVNQVSPTMVNLGVSASSVWFGWNGDGSVTSTFTGEALFAVNLSVHGGDPTDVVLVYLTVNGVQVGGQSVVRFGADGLGSATLAPVPVDVVVGDVIAVMGVNADGAGTGTVTTLADPGSDHPYNMFSSTRTAAPAIHADLELWDSADTLIRVVDTWDDPGTAIKLSGVTQAPAGGRVKAFVTVGEVGDRQVTVAQEAHMDVFYVSPPVVQEVCPT